MMVSLVKGLAASLYAVVHSVPYQYQLDNFQQVKNVSKAVVKVVMCSRGGSASEVETHKNIDSVLHTKTTFQAHSIFSVSIQK